MRLGHRTCILILAAAVLVSCALMPLSSGAPESPNASGPPPTRTQASTAPTLDAPSSPAPPIAEPTSSTAVPSTEPTASASATWATELPSPIDFSSAGWFQWLHTPDYIEGSLWVGRLDGQSFEVIESAPGAQGFGSYAPGNGTLLTSWVMNEGRSIDLVDTATGFRSNVASPSSYTVGTFDATGSYVYWVEREGGAPTGLWRRSTSLEPAEKVMDGRDVPDGDITYSSDGKYLAVSVCRRCGPGTMEANFDYAIFDARFKLVGELKNTSHGGILGFLGDRLVVYPHFTDDGSGPLSIVDIHDWSSQEIASSADFESAAILPDVDGAPRLLFDGADQSDRYTLKVLDPDDAVRVLFTGEAPFYDSPESMVLGSGGIHAPGWVAVFPRGDAMTDAALSGGDQGLRRLIRISDGTVVMVPPLIVHP
jgi:hypothetical protein